MACARCGKAARADDTYLCLDCLGSRLRLAEQAAAETIHPGDYKSQRATLTTSYDWQGWHRYLSAEDKQRA